MTMTRKAGERLKIHVSGVHSGPSPSPGLGVARSLRLAFPEACLVAVDYWDGSSGLHHEAFDEVLLQPSFELIDRSLYAAEIRAALERGELWIPTLDLEARWLAREIGEHPGLLSPSRLAIDATRKPDVPGAELLGIEAPRFIRTSERTDAELYEFCRESSWSVWLKGPYYEAARIHSWRELEHAREAFRLAWNTDDLFLQAHRPGHEESICFAAYRGELLGAISMRKKATTVDGKTWSGKIVDLEPTLAERLARALKSIRYTGGGELELMRDADGQLSLIEWNPRFPAWIHGSSLSGRNLPALLAARASGERPRPLEAEPSEEFTRVVVELPVRPGLSLPNPPERTSTHLSSSGKYGTVFRSLTRELGEELARPDSGTRRAPVETLDTELASALKQALGATDLAVTPSRLYLEDVARRSFESVARRCREASTRETRILPAYSFKTCSEAPYLSLAREHGLLAECISQWELKRALELGYPPSQIILNGPGKFWPAGIAQARGLRALFCDSAEELERVVEDPGLARVIGLRLRVPGIHSRFGIAVDRPVELERVVDSLSKLPPRSPIGLHFHMASNAIGVGRWKDAFESLFYWGRALEEATGHEVRTLDLGGGWLQEDFERLSFPALVASAQSHLGSLEEILLEPGKALTRSSMALATRVLEVRRDARGKILEASVDASIAELPIAGAHPQRVLRSIGPDRLEPLARGSARLVGRICMEEDILATQLKLPESLKPGDPLVFLDAGAYQRSMSYDFGRGGYPSC